MLLAFQSRLLAFDYSLEVICNSKQESNAQVYYDIGYGYNERHSITLKIEESNKSTPLYFQLPALKINKLRFDPLNNNGMIEIEKISIKQKRSGDQKAYTVKEFSFVDLLPNEELKLIENKKGTIFAKSAESSRDPTLELHLNRPLNHWNFKDYFDNEWIKKSVFFTFLIIPVAISLSIRE